MGEVGNRGKPLSADPEWRALAAGVSGAIAILLVGAVIGLVEGNLLPSECQGLACLFTGIVLGYAGVVAAIWTVVGVAVALARRRWPTSTGRLWALRILAVLSWVPVAWLVALALE